MRNQRVNPQPNTSPPTNLNTNPMFQNRPAENYQNDFHPVGSSNPIPTPPEPMINKSQDVNDILKRLHQNEGTEEESSVNNDRILSDTTISEGGTRRRKKRPMMVIT